MVIHTDFEMKLKQQEVNLKTPGAFQFLCNHPQPPFYPGLNHFPQLYIQYHIHCINYIFPFAETKAA